MSAAAFFSPRLGSFTRCPWRPRGLRGLFGGRKVDEEKDKRNAKFRINDLADLSELRKNGGKQWEAADDLTPVEDSPLFPTVTGNTLSGHTAALPGNLNGNVALVAVSMRPYGMHQCGQYIKPYVDALGCLPEAAVFELSLVDKWVYRMMLPWMTRNLIKTLSHDKHDHFMLYAGRDVHELRATLQLRNSIIGYVFLVDPQGKIRWRAHASPSQKEIAALLNCTRQLA